MIDNYRKQKTQIEEKLPNFIFMRMVQIDCRDIKKELKEICDQLISLCLERIMSNTDKAREEIKLRHAEMFEIFATTSIDAKILQACERKIDSIEKSEQAEILAGFKQVVNWMMMLSKNDFKFKDGFLSSIKSTSEQVRNIENKLEAERDKVETNRKDITGRLNELKDTFKDQLNKEFGLIVKFRTFGGLFNYADTTKDVNAIMKVIKKLEQDRAIINDMEDKLGQKPTPFEEFDKAKRELDPYHELWNLIAAWKTGKEEWDKSMVYQLDYETMVKQKKTTQAKIGGLLLQFHNAEEEKKPSKPIKVCREMETEFNEFDKVLPVVQSLVSKGMQDRHWEKVNKECEEAGIELEWTSKAQYTLKEVREKKMENIKDSLLEISDRANREYLNESMLNEMEKEWEPLNIQLKKWKETGTFVITGETVDDLTAYLDDHIVKTQTMKGSTFAKEFAPRINIWEKNLLYIRDTLDVWLQVQAAWLYLQPIFLSPDIKRDLQNAGQKFNRIDRQWRELMENTLREPRAIDLPNNQQLKLNLDEMLTTLDEIQSKLNDYLNKKRAQFPRFYFLSTDGLIEVLSEARDPTRIQKFVKILFEGIKSFIFNDQEAITAMKSSEGEQIEFSSPVETRLHKGLVEQWLREFEETMYTEVRAFIEQSFEDFARSTNREKFIMDRPGMAVLNVNMTTWTRETEQAIREGGIKGLGQLQKQLRESLNKVVEVAKRGVSKLNLCTLESLIVLDVHNLVVVEDLIKESVEDVTDFNYLAQLRYYWQEKKRSSDQKDTVVKIINNVLDYNYEYLGNSSRLVITPLTDRCYRTLCGAIALFYGGAPEGPAGTGKTETVKDLAKALARMIIVYNCSDKLNFKGMAQFFKGLASTGGWSCFDEFNRITVDVLSVIAQQLQSIQDAIKAGKDEFFFVDTKIKLIPTCNVFITMNPGYAGRAELPDNLKVLFRAVAMMVPDYALIAEIRLYSFGFTQAKELGNKIVTTYKLCSEQIAYQKHYDYGMRAVNSVLKAAGSLRKGDPDEAEDVQILRAINEVNEAKFFAHDLPLFKAITSDLFPTTKIPEPDFSKLLECLEISITKRKLQKPPYFIEKIIQLYQMILVRHGLMVVGEPYSGKSSAIFVLADALELMQDKGYNERRVNLEIINPKSITGNQLYGLTDIATNEWTDGVLPVKFKKMANNTSEDRNWLWFDGPVDAIWIEDMNTVLDDNKKLCLSNGDIFYMSDTMNLIFEPMDLLVASPATVSRVGMIYMEPHMMGWMPLYQSWKLDLPETLEDYEKEDMDVYFINILTPLLEKFRIGYFEQTAKTMPQNMVETLLNIAKPYIDRLGEQDFYESMEFKHRKQYIDQVFAFATVWSLGASVTQAYRQKFDTTIRRFNNAPDPSVPEEFIKKHRKVKLSDSGRVFEVFLDIKVDKIPGEEKLSIRVEWLPWTTMMTNQDIPASAQASEIIVETPDSVRYSHLIKNYLGRRENSLICGPTGTGKTIYIKNIIKALSKKKFLTIDIGFSAQTTANQVQNQIKEAAKLVKRKDGTYGAQFGKTIVLFIDDLNMPKKEEYGAQPPIELLRQMLDQKGWFNHEDKTKPFHSIPDVIFISAMGPPGPGRNTITPRFQRHLSLLSFTELDGKVMEMIFQRILTWRMETGDYDPSVKKVSKQVVKATLEMYKLVCENFKPLPSKIHYTFNLRDFSKVIIGICLSDKDTIQSKEMMIKLWVHEVWRVFSDRLNSKEDREKLLNDHLKAVSMKVFGENFDSLMSAYDINSDNKIDTLAEMRELIFTDVMHSGTMKYRPYQLVTSKEKLYAICNAQLAEYDKMSEKPLNIVLFGFAIEHLLVISRILKLPGGNALLVGVGGSGRQSLTKLAAKIGDYSLFQIELSKNYGKEEWQEDMKSVMKSAGAGSNTVFLFRDNQIKEEFFIENINNLLNNGEIPNLFPDEEKGAVRELARLYAKEIERDDIETAEQQSEFFIETVKKKLHVVLCFSPLGESFRNSIRQFPSLVNCCTIDWFFEWPQEGLRSVAQQFLSKLDLEDDIREKCVEMVQYFHTSTEQWALKFKKELGRTFYVTPTSYIEMIGQLRTLLQEKRDEIKKDVYKYKNGYQMIIEAEESVGGMKEQLTEMVPKLEAANEETKIKIENTKVAQEAAAKVKIEVSKEEAIANEFAQKTKIVKQECEEELAKVLPTLIAARKGLLGINPDQLKLLKTSNTFVDKVLLVLKGLCFVLEPSLKKKKNMETMREEVDWPATAKLLLQNDKKLLENLLHYNDEEPETGDFGIVTAPIYKKIQAMFEDPANVDKLNEEAIAYSNTAAKDLFVWLKTQYVLYPKELAVRPKRKQLKEAEEQDKVAKESLRKTQATLQGVLDEEKKQTDLLNDALNRKKFLEDEYASCQQN